MLINSLSFSNRAHLWFPCLNFGGIFKIWTWQNWFISHCRMRFSKSDCIANSCIGTFLSIFDSFISNIIITNTWSLKISNSVEYHLWGVWTKVTRSTTCRKSYLTLVNSPIRAFTAAVGFNIHRSVCVRSAKWHFWRVWDMWLHNFTVSNDFLVLITCRPNCVLTFRSFINYSFCPLKLARKHGWLVQIVPWCLPIDHHWSHLFCFKKLSFHHSLRKQNILFRMQFFRRDNFSPKFNQIICRIDRWLILKWLKALSSLNLGSIL